MIVNSRKVVKILDSMYPQDLAYDWDNVGFQIGDINHQIRKILLALELNREVLDEAIANSVDLIVTHHPFLFKGIKKVVSEDYTGKIIMDMIKNNISLYVAHTNMDIADGGTNDYLAEILGVKNTQILDKTASDKYYKISVFVPEENIENFRKSLLSEDISKIGNYSSCSFTVKGEGTFKPLENSKPYLGSVGELEFVKESKLEFISDEGHLDELITKIKKLHPYEEVAIDILSLENEFGIYGLGRYGNLDNSLSLRDFSSNIKEILKVDSVRVVGNLDSTVKKIAICTGAGSDLVKKAKNKKCDVLITGDLKYHEAQDAVNMGMNIIDAGHYGTENIYMIRLRDKLIDLIEKKDYNLKVYVSNANINPIKTV